MSNRVVLVLCALSVVSSVSPASWVVHETTSKPHKSDGKYIFPGTKWCGKGNAAINYDDLGSADDTDRCCRAHDKESGGIKPGRELHGIFNTHSYTIKRCEADERLRLCLLDVDSTTSNLVGHVFFDVLKSKCYGFGKPQTCASKPWLGGCRAYTTLETFPDEWRIYENRGFKAKSTSVVRRVYVI